MKFVKWIIFIAFFALSESAPAAEKPLDDHGIANALITLTHRIIYSIKDRGSNSNVKEEFEGNVIEASIVPAGGYADAKFKPNNDVRTESHFNVSLNVYLRDFDHHFVTEVFLVYLGTVYSKKDEIVDNGRIAWNSITTTKLYFPNSDHLDIELLPNEYQYKPNEKEKVKQAIKSLLKSILHKYTENVEHSKTITSTLYFARDDLTYRLDSLLKNTSYTLDAIPGAGYTLTNVTLYGLWNLQGISYNTSNLEASPQLEVGQVTGTIVMEFKSGIDPPAELSFSASSIRMSMNQKAERKVDVQINGYSLKNTKTNGLLTDDESKTIVKQIESAIATSNVVSVWKKYR